MGLEPVDVVRALLADPTNPEGGAAAEQLHLPDQGVTGNGHGLIYETNSDAALEPVLHWLERHTGDDLGEGEG